MNQMKIDRFAVALANWTVNHRLIVILLCVIGAGLIASGAQKLDFATNYRIFFSGENPDLIAFEKFQATYTKNDNFFFVIKPNDGNTFSPRIAQLQEEITSRAWQIPYSIRVDSVSNFQHTWAAGDDLTVEDLIKNGADLTQTTLDAKREIAIDEPILRDNLVNQPGTTVGVNVVMQYPEQSLTEVPEATAKAREIVSWAKANYPDVTFALSGISMMNNSFSESAQIDAATLIPAMYGVLLLVTFISIRSISATIATLFVILLSTMVGMGAGGWMLVQLTPISMTAPTIILTLAIADSIHILISMREHMRQGMAKREAIVEAMRVNFLAVGITTLTTIVGFMALNFSDSPPFHHLGNITAAGIAGAWVFSIFMLPALISLSPMKVKAVAQDKTKRDFYDAIADFVIKRYRSLLLVGGAITISLAALVPSNTLDDTWTKYFDESIEFRRDSDFAMANLSGLYPIEFSVTSERPGGISEPEFLHHLDRFTEWLRDYPDVVHVYTLSDIMMRLNKNMHGDDPNWYKLPDDSELSAQYLLLYELSLPYGLDLNDRINLDKSATRVTATLGNVSTVETRAFIKAANLWIEENLPEYMHNKPTGATAMFSYIAKRNILSMIEGNAVAIALIAMVMIVTLRSFSMGLLSMIPNTIPVLVTFGIWSILVGIVGLAAATITATSLGIVVDDTVHFLTKYLRGKREKALETADAIRYAFKNVGKAIAVNTLILASGFFVLAFSSFKINQEMGLLTGIAVVSALVLDFLLLPALLLAISGRKKRTVPTANPQTA